MSKASGLKIIIDNLTLDPKRVFLIDGVGAFISAFFLVVIIAGFQDSIGMPRRILYFLSVVALTYSIYSFCCYFFIPGKWRPFLKAIILANTVYCCLTIGLVVYFYNSLTGLGLIYFFNEIILMIGLIILELRTISRL